MLKPHRIVSEKLNSYAAEAQAFMRRRRHHRRPYIRIQYRDGDAMDLPLDSPEAAAINGAADALAKRAPRSE